MGESTGNRQLIQRPRLILMNLSAFVESFVLISTVVLLFRFEPSIIKIYLLHWRHQKPIFMNFFRWKHRLPYSKSSLSPRKIGQNTNPRSFSESMWKTASGLIEEKTIFTHSQPEWRTPPFSAGPSLGSAKWQWGTEMIQKGDTRRSIEENFLYKMQ